MRICGVVVLYNPIDEVLDNISTYLSLVDKLFVCDNSTKVNQSLIDSLRNKDNVEIIDMQGNQGIAKALKIAVANALSEGYDFCLTMDQDSKFPTDQFNTVLEYLGSSIADEYGIIGTNYNSDSSTKRLVDIKCWITSGNFINLKNYAKIDGFKEELFIDYVDFELNEQFSKIGKKIGYIENVSLIHEIGDPLIKRFLWKRVTCMNHSLIRYYYRYRNGLYLYKRNKSFYKEKYKRDLYVDTFKLIMFEPLKLKKLKMIKKARKDAKKGILGQYKGEK